MLSNYFKTTTDKKYRQLPLGRPGSFIVGTQVTMEDLVTVSELTGLTLADIDDVLDEHELPRIEKEDQSVIIFLRTPVQDSKASTQTLALIYSPDYLIALSRKRNQFVDDLFASSLTVATTQKSKLLIALLHAVAHAYTLQVRELRKKTQFYTGALENVDMHTIKQLIYSEEILNQYLASLSPMKTVYDVILSGKSIQLFEEDSDLVEDALISITQSVEICSVNLKSIRSIRDSYQILFSNQLNQTMKFLTSITIILTIPTILASMFGMNVGLPLSEHPFAFLFVVMGSVIVSILLLIVFWLKKWV